MSNQQIGAIAAMTKDRVIGLKNDIPWRYPEDWKRFKQVTMNSTVIMGRKTWQSIGAKALPKRQNIVISRSSVNGAEHASSTEHSLELATQEAIWFIGGGHVYKQALAYCQLLDITWVPDIVHDKEAILFPEIDSGLWLAGPTQPLGADPRLTLQRFTRN